ncbi:MAG: hypothetical protein EOO14_02055 [Chitinophagaceae bacterium]|nr:MAG: hypothetical protein EOO14_02055 [Chitinophagaceae bacterium]
MPNTNTISPAGRKLLTADDVIAAQQELDRLGKRSIKIGLLFIPGFTVFFAGFYLLGELGESTATYIVGPPFLIVSVYVIVRWLKQAKKAGMEFQRTKQDYRGLVDRFKRDTQHKVQVPKPDGYFPW